MLHMCTRNEDDGSIPLLLELVLFYFIFNEDEIN